MTAIKTQLNENINQNVYQIKIADFKGHFSNNKLVKQVSRSLKFSVQKWIKFFRIDGTKNNRC